MLCKVKRNLNLIFFLILIPSISGYSNFEIQDHGLEWVELTWNTSESVSMFYSTDNSSFILIKEFDFINNIAVQPDLQPDTLYYFKIVNSTNNEIITQRTKDIFESNNFYYYTLILVISVIFMFLYTYNRDILFSTTSGFLVLFMAMNLSSNNFPNLMSEFIKVTIATVLWGLAMILLIVPNLYWMVNKND